MDASRKMAVHSMAYIRIIQLIKVLDHGVLRFGYIRPGDKNFILRFCGYEALPRSKLVRAILPDMLFTYNKLHACINIMVLLETIIENGFKFE